MMEVQTSPTSQAFGGYSMSETGEISMPGLAAGLRRGGDMEVPDALTSPVEPAPNERPVPKPVVKRSGPPALLMVFGLLVLVIIVVLLIITGVFGLFG
jgi:hypothetical protein